MKMRVLFLFMILMTVHNSYCMEKENSESRKGMSQSGMFDLNEKKSVYDKVPVYSLSAIGVSYNNHYFMGNLL